MKRIWNALTGLTCRSGAGGYKDLEVGYADDRLETVMTITVSLFQAERKTNGSD